MWACTWSRLKTWPWESVTCRVQRCKSKTAKWLLPTCPPSVGSLFPSTTFNLEVSLPSQLNIGAAYYFNEEQTSFLAAQLTRTGWHVYQELRFMYAESVGGEPALVSTRNYEDSFIYRLGGQIAVSPAVQLRAGVYFDKSAVPEATVTPETPDTEKSGFALGATLMPSKKLGIDAAFVYLHGKERTTTNAESNFEATYKSQAIVPSVGLHLKF